MKRPIFTFLIPLTALILAACGASPPVRYYSLEPAGQATTGAQSGELMIGLGPLRVPDYLKRSRLVTRGAGPGMDVHEYSRWVEPVDKAMHRVLAANVDSRVDRAVVLAYPYLELLDMDYVVLGQVDRFDSDASGNVVLTVQWTVMDEENQALISPQRSSYEIRASNPADHGSIAQAMTAALGRFGEDIARQLNESLP